MERAVCGVRREPGGSVGLPNLLAERWGPISADLERYYGKDARELWRRQPCPAAGPASEKGGTTGEGSGGSGRWYEPALGVRRLIELLAALPEESALRTAVRGIPLEEVWTVQCELLATIAELVSVSATEKHRIRKPVEIPRPHHQRAPASTPLSPGDAARELAARAGTRVRTA